MNVKTKFVQSSSTMLRLSNTPMCSHQSMFNATVTSITNGFLKFLTRFSGRRRTPRRHSQQPNHCPTSASSHYFSRCKLNLVIPVVLLLLLSTIIDVTDACNSRTVPRPRTTPAPQPSTTPRPNITFPTFKCPPEYATWYCLNGATCFSVRIGKEVLYNCECPDGFIGPRCDYKDLDGSYLAGRPRVMLETASIAGGAVAALFLSFVVGFFVYVRWHQNKKRDLTDEDGLQHPQNGHSNGHHNEAADVVDGPSADGTSCSCQQSQVYYSQLSSNVTNTTNGDSCEHQHPQQQQFQAVPHIHHHQHRPPKRPFGPHHYHPISMSDVLLKR